MIIIIIYSYKCIIWMGSKVYRNHGGRDPIGRIVPTYGYNIISFTDPWWSLIEINMIIIIFHNIFFFFGWRSTVIVPSRNIYACYSRVESVSSFRRIYTHTTYARRLYMMTICASAFTRARVCVCKYDVYRIIIKIKNKSSRVRSCRNVARRVQSAFLNGGA